VEARYCPACGAMRRDGAGYCVSCGGRISDDPFSVPTEFLSETTVESSMSKPVTPDTKGKEQLLIIARIVTSFSPIPAVFYFLNNSEGTDLALLWTVSVLIPALMVCIPVIGEKRLAGIRGIDARYALLSTVTAMFVALRAVGALVDGNMPIDSFFRFSQILGIAGFVVVGMSFPWGKSSRSWFVETFNPVHIGLSCSAALVFFVCRVTYDNQFFLSAGSISGPSIFEYVFIALLISTGFLRSPWRQFVAISIGQLSILSFAGNVIFFNGPIKPWPNPVVFACCLALCFPVEDLATEKDVAF